MEQMKLWFIILQTIRVDLLHYHANVKEYHNLFFSPECNDQLHVETTYLRHYDVAIRPPRSSHRQNDKMLSLDIYHNRAIFISEIPGILSRSLRSQYYMVITDKFSAIARTHVLYT